LVGLSAVASMETALEETIAYTKSREAFGKPLIEFQNTQFVLAEAATKVRVARVFVDSCIQEFLRGELDSTQAAMCKWWLSEMQCDVIDKCLQLFGGYGYMTEYPIARMYADARVQKIYGGSNEIMKLIIARSL
jgi:acyl-CoA dehydrogenase